MHRRSFTFNHVKGKITFDIMRKLLTAVRSKLGGEFVRVATNLAIGVVGLVMIRLIVQGLHMYQ